MNKEKSKKKHFSVAARAILSFGRESIKEATTALVELVKNSYDADAETVIVDVITDIEKPYIRIADNGSGMSEKDIIEKWLLIGFSDKSADGNKVSSKGRRKTGEKGIGRISADRLGRYLTLKTRKDGELNSIKIDWKQFEDERKPLNEIELEEETNPQIKIPPKLDNKVSESGTELIIEGLRDTWSKDDIEELRRELSILISPFAKIRDFEIYTNTDIDDAENGIVSSEMNKDAVICLSARYKKGDEKLRYAYKIIGNKKIFREKIALNQLLEIRHKKDTDDFSLECGNTQIKLLFYVRTNKVFETISINKKAVSSFIDRNAGIKIYRDKVWVKPYGEIDKEEWDWLNLGRRYARNPAGAGRKSFQLRPQQVVGVVSIGRDVSPIIDSAGREGLIKGEAYNDLKKLTISCISLIENEYHSRYKKDNKEQEQKLYQDVKEVSHNANSVLKDMQRIAPMIAQSKIDIKIKDKYEESLDKVKKLSSNLRDVKDSVFDSEREKRLYRGLATVGISMTIFSHEIETPVNTLLNHSYRIQSYLKANPPKVEKASDRIEKIISLSDSISEWGKYALTRIKRDKRTRTKKNIKDIMSNVIKDLLSPLTSANISVDAKLSKVVARVFIMDIEAILINLLTNSYSACLQVPRDRKIRVELNKKGKGFEIVVADTGPGVSNKFEERIWEPLFTTKKPGQRNAGTGLGLAIIDSIVKDSGGKRIVTSDSSLKGAKFSVWLPIV